MDKLYIRHLCLKTLIGTHPEEREGKQTLFLDLDLYCDLAPAGHSDQLVDTVDYECIQNRILKLADQSQFLLIEAFAEEIARIVLEDSKVEKVLVRIEKPAALEHAACSGLEILRPIQGAHR
jgi:FolB domain-containing protein